MEKGRLSFATTALLDIPELWIRGLKHTAFNFWVQGYDVTFVDPCTVEYGVTVEGAGVTGGIKSRSFDSVGNR
jgi:hypothetical protein